MDGHGISGKGKRVVPVFAIVDPSDESVDDVLRDTALGEESKCGNENTDEGVDGGGGGSRLGIGVALLVGGRLPRLDWLRLVVLEGGYGFEGRGGNREGRMDWAVAGVWVTTGLAAMS